MNHRILVTYATRAGSTQEVANYIGKVLHEAGAEVDIRSIQDISDIRQYNGAIIGSAIRVGKPLPEAVKFVKQFKATLDNIPTAYFVVCATLSEDTLENRKIVETYLNPLCAIHQPLRTGFFAGKVDRTKLEQPMRFFLRFAKEPPMSGGDWRNWDAIEDWAESLVPDFVPVKV